MKNRSYIYSVITLSDKGFEGKREDKNYPLIKRVMGNNGFDLSDYVLIPDEKNYLTDAINKFRDKCDIILTNGGTGLSPRDITPDVTLKLIDKRLYGFELLIMRESLNETPFAALSRAVCGTIGRTIIINLPGSPDAVRSNLNAVIPILKHAIDKLQGDMSDCADIKK
ncbi:MAG: molybdenum cofactor biosynthesis protein [Proteobacteria bacterium]|nr:molybdenum cofactor biosynthesis protein [Pseudomonadota bacterium]